MSEFNIGYSMPSHAPFYPEPPYLYRGTQNLIGVWTGEEELLRSVLPEPLELAPERQVIGVVAHYPHVTGLGTYNVAALFIRARYKELEGVYNCHIYMDSDIAIAAGREIWGFPKQFARVSLTRSGEIVTGMVERGNIAIMTLSVNMRREATTKELPPAGTIFNLKVIPSPEKGEPPEVRELTVTQHENVKTYRLLGGAATVRFEESPSDPLYIFKPLKMLGGFYAEQDIDLVHGRILHKYR
jgi:acetoacetate decarboxylase